MRRLFAIACLGAACARAEELEFFDVRADGSTTSPPSGPVGPATTSVSVGVTTGATSVTTSVTSSTVASTSGGAAGASRDAGFGGGGAAGTGGTRDAAVDRPVTPTNGLSVLYKVGHTEAMANAIMCELTIDDAGPDTFQLSELSLRYYFTNEVVGAPMIDIGFSGRNPGFHDLKALETTRVVPLSSPTFTADDYIEFAFVAGAGPIMPGQSVIVSWQYHGPNFPLLTQSNDYSFDATKTNTVPWDHVTLHRNGNLVWGVPPS